MQPAENDIAPETAAAAAASSSDCASHGVFFPPKAVWLASLIPVCVALFVCFHFGFQAPYMDQWELVPLLEKAFSGQLAPGDVWAQHNVHRIPIPKLIMLGLARLSHWDTRWERAVSMAFALTAAALLLRIVLRAHLKTPNAPWTWLLVVSLFFSPAQWENLLWGWHLLIYLNVLGAILVCWGLPAAGTARMGIPVAVAGAVLAVFSYGNGLILLPVGLAVLILKQCPPRMRALPTLAFWCAVSMLIGGSYIWGFQKPSYDPSYAGVVTSPAQYAYYVAAYLGAPLATFDTRPAAMFGAAGLIAFTVLFAVRIRRQEIADAMLPLDGLALYAIGTAFLTATARTGFGVVQALSPRYLAFSSLLWIALLVHMSRCAQGRSVRRATKRLLLAAIFLAGIGVAANFALGVYRCDERYDGHVAARDALITGGTPELLRRLYPDESAVLEARKTLMKHRLNVFR